MRGLAPWVLAISVGCGPGSIGDEGSGEGSGDASTGSPTSATGLDDATTRASTDGPSATDSDSSGSGSATAADSSGTDTGPVDCPPPEPGIVAGFEVSPDVDVSATCTVMSATFDATTSTTELDCGGAPVTLTTTSEPDGVVPFVLEGSNVRLEYVTDPSFSVNRWFALHSADGLTDYLLLGGISSSALDPPGTTLHAFFGAGNGEPLVSEVAGVCEPFVGRCGEVERVALELSVLDGMATTLAFDQGVGFINVLAFGYRLMVETAVHNLPPIACDDVPEAWVQALVVYFPSD